MSDNLKFYLTITGIVVKSRVPFHDLGCLVTFVWYPALSSGSANVKKLPPDQVGAATAWKRSAGGELTAVFAQVENNRIASGGWSGCFAP